QGNSSCRGLFSPTAPLPVWARLGLRMSVVLSIIRVRLRSSRRARRSPLPRSGPQNSACHSRKDPGISVADRQRGSLIVRAAPMSTSSEALFVETIRELRDRLERLHPTTLCRPMGERYKDGGPRLQRKVVHNDMAVEPTTSAVPLRAVPDTRARCATQPLLMVSPVQVESPARCPTETLFISYRRGDSAAYAGRLCDRLSAVLGVHRVFMDVEEIQPGENFAQ